MPKSAKKKTLPKKTKPREKVSYKFYLIHYSYCLAIIVLLTIASINLNNYLNSQKVLGASVDASPLQNEKNYWQDLVSKNPSYVDGYLQLAKVSVELGNTNEAQSFINKAISLDPNSTKIISVERELGL